MGYRINNSTGVAVDNQPETIYMLTSGTKGWNNGCCFDFGNAEANDKDDGASTMEAVYFGTWNATASGWCGGAGPGPWVVGQLERKSAIRGLERLRAPSPPAPHTWYLVPPFSPLPSPPQMADLENGLWACADTHAINPNSTSFGTFDFVMAMVKGGTDGFALKGGDATAGTLGKLNTLYEGPRPPGYQPMHKQGSIILGIGGDNSDSAIGSFFEGVVTQGYSTDEADDAVHADIVAAGYGA
jgi:hypothetical protein